ncbi:ABSCISIC ACID-INSENSITIVE 5-like protein 5 [Platanthera guangdongensis]|uniref:ABSCISIC ACID-INSENSITIVE 5-like protein 5 n=1 Tax=Platanthera guangdongensis TaxID=2320717 RepID=A0ABR2N4Q6_9ASPA
MGTDNKDFRLQPGVPAAIASLARQPSTVYSLTFDEFQSSMGGIGKDYGSMNMDEFLKNIWTAEENQAMASALGASDGGGDGGAQAGLQRQGSLTLPRTLSTKTVDEVWRDLTNESSAGAGADGAGFQQQQMQPTLGEMTLEEFLVRAGVVREENDPSISRPVVTSAGVPAGNSVDVGNSVYFGDLPANNDTGLSLAFTQADRSYFGVMPSTNPCNSSVSLAAMPAVSNRPYSAQFPMGTSVNLGSPRGMRGGGLVGIRDPAISNGLITGVVGFGGGGVNLGGGASVSPATQNPLDGLMKGNGELSSLSPVPYAFGGGLRGRKRSGAVEKVVERRQKRMIKNRESAARSRARKQAYTMELEDEVAKLKEQNLELQRKQVVPKSNLLLISNFRLRLWSCRETRC